MEGFSKGSQHRLAQLLAHRFQFRLSRVVCHRQHVAHTETRQREDARSLRELTTVMRWRLAG